MDTNKMRDLKALAEAASQGYWVQEGFEVQNDDVEDYRVAHCRSHADAAFIAAASPAMVLALLAQIERLKAGVDSDWAEVERIQGIYTEQFRKARALRIERDQLKTDNEAWRLTLEAERRIKRITADEIGKLKAENEALRKTLLEASEEVATWGEYASEYFQKKHDLAGCVAKIHAAAMAKGAIHDHE